MISQPSERVIISQTDTLVTRIAPSPPPLCWATSRRRLTLSLTRTLTCPLTLIPALPPTPTRLPLRAADVCGAEFGQAKAADRLLHGGAQPALHAARARLISKGARLVTHVRPRAPAVLPGTPVPPGAAGVPRAAVIPRATDALARPLPGPRRSLGRPRRVNRDGHARRERGLCGRRSG